MMRRTWYSMAVLASLTSVPFGAAAAITIRAEAIAWRPCLVDETGVETPALGNRLQCASMSVPLDHNQPTLGEVDVGLIRVQAADANQRKGILFFNVGGPGGQSPALRALDGGLVERDRCHRSRYR